MKVLVTGAGGFLGRAVVEALSRRGHEPRGLDVAWPADAPAIEHVLADLCDAPDLSAACRDAQVVVHLAARLGGPEAEVIRTARDGTGRLLDAMAAERVRRLVLASSLSVYDWTAPDGILSEDAPLETRPEERDAYTTAKLEQERVARERCAATGVELVVLRPGVLWGHGRELPPTIGQRAGPFYLVVAGARPLPAVHVDNCADAFATAAEAGLPPASTFNVVDHPDVSARRFLDDALRRGGRSGVVLPVGYAAARAFCAAVERAAPAALRPRLPSFLAPRRFAARYRPVRIDGARFHQATGWAAPVSYAGCLDRTYGPG